MGHRTDAARYEIRVTGHLDARWITWFDGLRVSRENDGTTVIAGEVADQAALHGLLQRVRNLGLPLVAVTRVGPPRASRPRTAAARTQSREEINE